MRWMQAADAESPASALPILRAQHGVAVMFETYSGANVTLATDPDGTKFVGVIEWWDVRGIDE